jgi:hypothetical protein
VRENCPACLSGEQHQSYVLYSRLNGRRFAVYVPEELVPELRRCVDNGRALQELLQEAAPRYVKALKRERSPGQGSQQFTGDVHRPLRGEATAILKSAVRLEKKRPGNFTPSLSQIRT